MSLRRKGGAMDVSPRIAHGPTSVGFLRDLGEMYRKITVTLGDGSPLDLEIGLAKTIGLMKQSQEKGNKLILIGNGGSAAVASHQAIDYWKNGGLEAITFNEASLLTCISNDFGYERVFAEPIKRFARPGDVLLAISSSGRSRNILNAVEAARFLKCHVVTFSGFEESNLLRSMGDLNFYVPSHSYGIVEISHLALIHGMLEDIMAARPGSKS